MKKVIFLFMCILLLLPFRADAADKIFKHAIAWDPQLADKFIWQPIPNGKYILVSGHGMQYMIRDFGTTWYVSGDNASLGDVVFICPPEAGSYLDCGLDVSNVNIPKREVPPGYYILMGRMVDPPPPLPQPPSVSISPDSGDFSDYLEVVISSSNGGTIYYSLDGSEPSIPYNGSIRITDTKTVKAKAVNAGGTSSVVTKTYTKKIVPLSLTISPDTSLLDKPLDVSLIPSESDAVVYYSLDGSEPSIRYTGAIRIDRPLTLKAKAVKGGRESPVYQKVYKRPPIMHTDEKFFQIPVDLPAVVKGATDYISVASPGVWLFAVTFLGLLILAVAKRVFRK